MINLEINSSYIRSSLSMICSRVVPVLKRNNRSYRLGGGIVCGDGDLLFVSSKMSVSFNICA